MFDFGAQSLFLLVFKNLPKTLKHSLIINMYLSALVQAFKSSSNWNTTKQL